MKASVANQSVDHGPDEFEEWKKTGSVSHTNFGPLGAVHTVAMSRAALKSAILLVKVN